MESPAAQWLEHPTRLRRVMGSNPNWSLDFFQVSYDAKTYHDVISNDTKIWKKTMNDLHDCIFHETNYSWVIKTAKVRIKGGKVIIKTN